HSAQSSLRPRGGILHLALELEAEAVVSGNAQQRQTEAAALELDLHHHIAVGARSRDELSGVDADEGIGLGAAPAELGRAGVRCRGMARGRPVQDEIEDVAEAGSGRNERSRVELWALEQQGE